MRFHRILDRDGVHAAFEEPGFESFEPPEAAARLDSVDAQYRCLPRKAGEDRAVRQSGAGGAPGADRDAGNAAAGHDRRDGDRPRAALADVSRSRGNRDGRRRVALRRAPQ